MSLHLPVHFQASFGVRRSSGRDFWKIIVLQISEALKISVDRSDEWLKVKHAMGLAG